MKTPVRNRTLVALDVGHHQELLVGRHVSVGVPRPAPAAVLAPLRPGAVAHPEPVDGERLAAKAELAHHAARLVEVADAVGDPGLMGCTQPRVLQLERQHVGVLVGDPVAAEGLQPLVAEASEVEVHEVRARHREVPVAAGVPHRPRLVRAGVPQVDGEGADAEVGAEERVDGERQVVLGEVEGEPARLGPPRFVWSPARGSGRRRRRACSSSVSPQTAPSAVGSVNARDATSGQAATWRAPSRQK